MHYGLKLLFLVLLLSLAGLSAACSKADSGPTSSNTDPISASQLALLPASTRSVLWVDLDGLLAGPSASEVRDSLAGHGKEPALSMALELVQRLLVGIDPATVDSALLLQTTDAAERFALVAELTPGATLKLAAFAKQGSHRGHQLYADAKTGLELAQLEDGLVVIGEPSLLKTILDVEAGAAKSAQEGAALSPYLSALDKSGSLRFVVGLPALYHGKASSAADETLLGARAVSGSITLDQAHLSGAISFFTPNAEAFATRFTGIMGDKVSGLRFEPASASVVLELDKVPFAKTPKEHLASRGMLKRLFHGMNAVDYARGVGAGGNPPWMNFEVGTKPNSIFINFRFKDEAQVAAFEAAELPKGFKLMKVSIFENEEPGYFLVVNAYQSGGGLVMGARVEWSVFVQDPDDGKPRFLVAQAAAESVAADSVNLLTMPEPVKHELTGNVIATHVGVKDGDTEKPYFKSEISWPPANRTLARTATEFVASNDYIFWGNGVADRGLYNATVYNREVVRIEGGDITVDDQSRWAGYIEAQPAHAFVYQGGLEIVVSPWWNLDADYLDVTADHLKSLKDFKDGFYPGTIKVNAEKAMQGEGAVLSSLNVANAVPSTFYQFAIQDPAALEAALHLPAGHRLAKVRVFADDAQASHVLTLNVYEVEGDPSGVRAEWYAYTDDGSGHVHRMVIDASSAEVRVDPITLLGLPDVVTQTLANGKVSTHVASLRGDFSAALDLAQGEDAQVSLDWIESDDNRCWTDGVCNKTFYEGATLNEPVTRLAPEAVADATLHTAWGDLIAKQPTSVFVRRAPQIFAQNPWHNVP